MVDSRKEPKMWGSVHHTSLVFTDLVEEASSGGLALPSFQRKFVWEPSDILALLDSMLREFPIGSLLFWENWNCHTKTARSFAGTAAPKPGVPLVLDGQQRVQALLIATKKGSGYAYEVAGDRFVVVDNPRPETGHMPCSSLIDFMSFMDELSPMWDALPRTPRLPPPIKKRGKLIPPPPPEPPPPLTDEQIRVKNFTHRCEAVMSRFRSVRIGAIVIPASKDEAFCREAFRRMNLTGKAFTEADVFDCLQS